MTHGRTHRTSPTERAGSAAEVSAPRPSTSAGFWIAATCVGLVLRLALLPLSPRYGDPYDHDDLVRWGIQATDRGVLTLYDRPPPPWNLRLWSGDRWITQQRDFDRLCVYPPLTVYLTATAGAVFKLVSADRLINTLTSRAVFASWSIVADLLLAAGCAAIVHRYKPGRPARIAYVVALLAPPFWWVTAVWGQTDTALLAAGVWMVWAMLGSRWLLAGVLFGVAAMLKPHAVLFLPVWVLALAMRRPLWKPLVALGVSAATALLIALPFTLSSGLAWWRQSYVQNLATEFPQTTLMAFNLWYADLLSGGSDDVTGTWLGVAKDVWGRGLLAAALLAGFVWACYRWRRDTRGLLLWTLWVLLAAVMLPTRVHERYILLGLPFLIAATLMWRRFWPILIVLVVVATAQVSWQSWMRTTPTAFTRYERLVAPQYESWRASLAPAQRASAPSLHERLAGQHAAFLKDRALTEPLEWLLVVLALAATGATAGVILSVRPAAPSVAAPAAA